jgi:feruloyl esterase
VSHPGANDRIGIDVWMPLEGWNGRFVGVGGGGYSGGSPNAMGGPVSEGYATATTDAGHPPTMSGGFALDKNGRLNWTLVRDFSYVGLHDLAVVGKSVTAAFYGSAPKYAYWNGCSTGGRQGLAEAQRYPQDYNGVLSAAPAINWSRFIPAEFWPALVMLRDGDFLPQCKFAAFQDAAVKSCDTVGDAVNDGVIGDPLQCKFDTNSLIGATTPCGTITAQDAAVVEKILRGPRSASGQFLWYGLTPGTTFSGIATTITKDGTTTGTPFMIALDHIRLWLLQDPSWDWTTATYDQYDQLFRQSVEEFTDVIGTDNADLSAFKKNGAKLLIWHGLNDQLIFPQGTINYYDRVTQFMGGTEKTRDFARLFLAPGVTHCSGGAGPQPDKPFDALVNWVEHGSAPTTLNGVVRDSKGEVTATRPICLYPETAAYKGTGPTTSASSFVCRSSKKK